jgi:alpha-galactosidase
MKTFPLAALLPLTQAADNGLALTPPMGWRSWNCYHGAVNQTLMEGIMDRMAERTRLVDGVPTSYADLGYANCGLDDNWQACGAGVSGSFHDAAGNPLVNSKTFPSMKGMTDHGHALGLRVGWYMNNCICPEHEWTGNQTYIDMHMARSAQAVADMGFDGLKLDGCGQFRNLTQWYALLNATGRPILVENCHWGGTVPGDTSGDGPCSGTGSAAGPVSDCPYNFFRTSGDISNSWASMTRNLASTTKFQGDPPLARPGTWAYPDMMQVGRLASDAEDRTHFGAWVITSSPLILGYDMNDEGVTDRIWSYVANREAIAVNQAWAGHPGRLVKTFPRPGEAPGPAALAYLWAVAADAADATQAGWVATASGGLQNGAGACLQWTGTTDNSAFDFVACDAAAARQRFTVESNGNVLTPAGNGKACLAAENGAGPGVVSFNCNDGSNEEWTLDTAAGTLCTAAGGKFPVRCLAKRAASVTPLTAAAGKCDADDATQKGWSHDVSTGLVRTAHGLCLDGSDAKAVALSACNASDPNQMFAYDAGKKSLRVGDWAAGGDGAGSGAHVSAMCLDVYDFKGPGVQLYACNYGANEQFDFNSDGTLTDNDSPKNCLGTSAGSASTGSWQLWTKKQAKGALAVFVINGDATGDAAAVTIVLKELVDADAGATYKVRDIWARKDLPGFATTTFTTASIGPHDSVMLLLTPM